MHSMALSQGYNYPYRDDDRIYVTDAADRTMRALALTPSPAPEIPSITTAIGVGSYPVTPRSSATTSSSSTPEATRSRRSIRPPTPSLAIRSQSARWLLP